jgi:rubrerythrin
MATLALYEVDRSQRGSLVCSVCGYGIARETPPGPCPMCRADDAWVSPRRRRFAAALSPSPALR